MLAIKQAEEMKAAQRKREVERIKREKAEKAAAKKRQLELWQLDHKVWKKLILLANPTRPA